MTGKNARSPVDEQIDENLRRVYDDVLKAEVPDKFLDLIEQLKKADGKTPDGAEDSIAGKDGGTDDD